MDAGGDGGAPAGPEADDKVPLLERKREIVAGQAKERQGERNDVRSDIPVNLPGSSTETRDSIAAVIGRLTSTSTSSLPQTSTDFPAGKMPLRGS